MIATYHGLGGESTDLLDSTGSALLEANTVGLKNHQEVEISLPPEMHQMSKLCDVLLAAAMEVDFIKLCLLLGCRCDSEDSQLSQLCRERPSSDCT